MHNKYVQLVLNLHLDKKTTPTKIKNVPGREGGLNNLYHRYIAVILPCVCSDALTIGNILLTKYNLTGRRDTVYSQRGRPRSAPTPMAALIAGRAAKRSRRGKHLKKPFKSVTTDSDVTPKPEAALAVIG